MTFSRPQKLEHIDTVFYEIDMLTFSYTLLARDKPTDQRVQYMSLECFLVHYRNLIEFFAGHGDLKVTQPNVWSPKKVDPTALKALHNQEPYRHYRGAISTYLQHCTKRRAIRDRHWNVREMYNELRPVLATFKKLFASSNKLAVTRGQWSLENASTATITTVRGIE